MSSFLSSDRLTATTYAIQKLEEREIIHEMKNCRKEFLNQLTLALWFALGFGLGLRLGFRLALRLGLGL